MAREESRVSELDIKRRATVHDVARAAGVSLATVDRVLNGRPGVRPATAEKVAAAVAELGFERDLSASLLARARDLNLVFLIPDGANEFMESLAAAASQRAIAARAERMQIEIRRLPALDPRALADALDALEPRRCDCAVIVASEDEPVFAAVERAHRRSIAVMTLVSDLPGSARSVFVGINNVAAGRTAASLLGRFCGGRGTVGVIAGSMHLRDHRERLDGFRAVMAENFPDIRVLDPVEGHDSHEQTRARATTLLAGNADLAGLYNLGAGNGGLVTALENSGRGGAVHVVAHELSGPTREGLMSGTIDVVLDQNPDGEIRAALEAARTLAIGGHMARRVEPIEIDIFLRDNLG